MARREKMSSIDTAWLRMDSPENLMMIVGVLMLGRRIDAKRLARTVEARLLRYGRFRQRVRVDATGAWWEDDPHFDLANHIERVKLARPAGKAELQAYVAQKVSEPLDPARPLWKMHLIENYEGGAALVSRIHHCIADGIALIGVMMSITDTKANAPIAPADSGPAPRKRRDAEDEGLFGELFAPVSAAASKAVRLASKAVESYVETVAQPTRLIGLAKLGAGIGSEVAQLALMRSDSPTRYKGKPGMAKAVAWSEPMALPLIKAAGKAVDCSVNDVLLSCVAGALRTYLAERGDRTAGVEMRAMVPVNLRPPGQESRLGNRFGLVGLVLPIGMENPLERLYEVGKRMTELKGSYQAAVTLGVLSVLGSAPRPVQKQILDMLSRKTTAVMTNVPGPRELIYIAGAPIRQQMFWVPQSGDVGMGVSILSYDDKVQFGLVTDRSMVPDPERIVDRFAAEFEQLLMAVLMQPWGRRSDPRALAGDIAALVSGGKPARRGRKGALAA